MKSKLSVLVFLLSLLSFGHLAIANENQELSNEDLDEIKSLCQEESTGAENPQSFVSDCVADRIQALKEEKGLAQPNKEES